MASEVPFQIMIGCLVYSLIGQVAIWRAWARVDWKDVKKGKIFFFIAKLS